MTKEELRLLVEKAIDQACGNDGKGRLYPDDSYLAWSVIHKLEQAGMLIPYTIKAEIPSEVVSSDFGFMLSSHRKPI